MLLLNHRPNLELYLKWRNRPAQRFKKLITSLEISWDTPILCMIPKYIKVRIVDFNKMFTIGWNGKFSALNKNPNSSRTNNTLNVALVKGQNPNFCFTKPILMRLNKKMAEKLARAAPSIPISGISHKLSIMVVTANNTPKSRMVL